MTEAREANFFDPGIKKSGPNSGKKQSPENRMADDEDLPLRRDRRRTRDVAYDESLGDDDDDSRIKVEPDWSDEVSFGFKPKSF